MKVAIVGSRNIGEEYYHEIKSNVPDSCSEIISGGARGVDSLAERYAAEHNLRITVIRPDYASFDRAAPIIRNSEIVAKADFVLVFWDGVSRGSLNVIMTCMKTGKPFKVFMTKT